MSEWISPAACQAVPPAAQVPGLRRLVLAGGEEGDQVEQREGPADHALRAPTRRRRARRASRPRPASSSSASSASMREETATARAPWAARVLGELRPGPRQRPRRRWPRTAPAWTVSEPEVARRVGHLGGRRHRARRAPGLQRLDHLASQRLLGHRRAVAALARAHDAIQPALGLLEVGQHQLGLDRLDVGQRVDAAIGVHDVVRRGGRGRRARSRRSRGCCARKRLPSPSPWWAPATRPAMSWKSIVSCTSSEAPHGVGHRLQPRVVDRHDGDVGLDRREGVVGGLGAGPGERVEQRGLARVGQPDDADAHAHERCTQPSLSAATGRAEHARRRARRSGSAPPGTAARGPGAPASPYSGPRGSPSRAKASAPANEARGVRAGEAQLRWACRRAGAGLSAAGGGGARRA